MIVTEYEDLVAVTDQEATTQLLSQEARQQHMYHIEAIALRNIDPLPRRMRDYSAQMARKNSENKPKVETLLSSRTSSLVVCSPPGRLTLTSVLVIPSTRRRS